MTDVRVLFRAPPTCDNGKHFGSRVAVGPDGMLYVTLGERSDAPMRPQARQLDRHLGKTIRIAPDGSIPRDNPFVGRGGALPEIWTTGHRNVQSASFDAHGRLWEVEMGTRGGGELNLIARGRRSRTAVERARSTCSPTATSASATSTKGRTVRSMSSPARTRASCGASRRGAEPSRTDCAPHRENRTD